MPDIPDDPYGQGWMFEVETDPATLGQQLAALMDANAYRDLAGHRRLPLSRYDTRRI